MPQASAVQKQDLTASPLIAIPLTRYTPQVVVLGEGPTAEIAASAYRKMQENFGDHPYLRAVAPGNGMPMRGSNSFIRYSIGPIVEKESGGRLRLITPAISEEIIAEAMKAFMNGDRRLLDKIKSFYEDPGVIVYGAEGPNEALRQNLLPQLKERGIELPAVVHGLVTVIDDKYTESKGLKFDLADAENVAYHAPILLEGTSKFRHDDPSLVVNGLPSKLGEGDRTLYTAKGGLVRLFRGGGLDLNADGDILAGSDGVGRVNFVGVAPQNLSPAIAELEVIAAKEHERVNERLKRAKAVLLNVNE